MCHTYTQFFLIKQMNPWGQPKLTTLMQLHDMINEGLAPEDGLHPWKSAASFWRELNSKMNLEALNTTMSLTSSQGFQSNFFHLINPCRQLP